MHRIYILSLLVLLASSCEMPYFDRYPGKALKEIPEDFRGNWVSYTISFEGGKLTYDDTTNYIISKDSWESIDKKNDKGLLSDSVVFSKYKDYYFLSFLAEHGWNCMVIQKKGKQFVLSMVFVDESDDDIDVGEVLKKYFSKATMVEKQAGEVDYYKIKMKEHELIKYFNKYLLKKYYLKFEIK